MSLIELLPDSGVSFANGVIIKIKKDSAGDTGNATLSMSGGPLAAVCAALNVPSLDLSTTIQDLGKLSRAINIANQVYSLV